MKKSLIFSISLLTLVCGLMGCKKTEKADDPRAKEVVIYTYDSFCGEWGAGPAIAELFEAKTGIKVTFAECSSGQLVAKAVADKSAPFADLAIGIDNNLFKQALDNDILMEYKPASSSVLLDGLSEELNQGGKWLLTPYDYSHFAMIFDSKSDIPAPKSLEEMTLPVYKDKIILMANTSTVGLGFDNWVKAAYGDKADDYMKRLEPSVLTVAPKWSAGYGMFTKGEAPLVISYTTSPASHIEYGEGDQYKALIFEEGHVRQIEGAGILKSAPNVAGAKQFIDFLISEEAQNLIPLTQWMFPANKDVKLPESYSLGAPVPEKTLKY